MSDDPLIGQVLEERYRKQERKPLSGMRATILGGFCVLSGAILVAFGGPWPVSLILFVLGLVLPLSRSR